MRGHLREVFICGEKRQIATDGELCKQGVNSADLNTCSATCIAQGRGIDVIISIGLKQRQGGKALDDLRSPLEKART